MGLFPRLGGGGAQYYVTCKHIPLYLRVSKLDTIYRWKSLATGATAHTGAYFGEGSGPIHLDFVQCSGSEYNLTDCEIRNDSVNHIRTNHSFDVGVKCQPGKVHLALNYLLEKPIP